MKNKKQIIIQNSVLKKLTTQINKGGVTYNPILNKDYNGTKNIAISAFPERSEIFKGNVTRKIVSDYCAKNSDLLEKGFPLGGWYNEKTKETYLDITTSIPLRRKIKAISLGKSANQIAGFNLFNFSEIPLGGTGIFNSSVSPFKERLRNASKLMHS